MSGYMLSLTRTKKLRGKITLSLGDINKWYSRVLSASEKEKGVIIYS